MTDTQTMRAEFEAYIQSQNPAANLTKIDGDKYASVILQSRWLDFQAAWTRKPAAQVAGEERTKLWQMQNDEGKIGWYFDCDGHFIDVECDDGKYSVFFRDRSTGSEVWFDQADNTHPAPEPDATKVVSVPTARERYEVAFPKDVRVGLGDSWSVISGDFKDAEIAELRAALAADRKRT